METAPRLYMLAAPLVPAVHRSARLVLRWHNAKQRLADIGRDQDIAEENQHLLQGHPARAIHHVAQEEDVDLIVVGSHGRHGLGLLLGSTANGVLHGASCDVLAVRLPDSSSQERPWDSDPSLSSKP